MLETVFSSAARERKQQQLEGKYEYIYQGEYIYKFFSIYKLHHAYLVGFKELKLR